MPRAAIFVLLEAAACATDKRSPRQARRPWAKSQTWRIAREMNRSELDATDLGQSLATL
jgi:hypothetical protein